jgi:hypothetical protein
MDGKIKAPPPVGRMGLVGLEIFGVWHTGPAGALARNIKLFNAPTAIHQAGGIRSHYDLTGRRLQTAPGPHPSRQPGPQASEESC